MPLPSPILDDRTYQQLAAELKARIPVFNPEWTDHNESDPAITLLELMAFHGEALLYRLNQVPEATYLEFLRLLQIPLRPLQAARALLKLSTEVAEGVLVPPQSLAEAGKLQFQTLTEATVWPVSAVAMVKAWAEPPTPDDESEVYEFVLRTLDALPPSLAAQPRIYYETKALDPADTSQPLDCSAAVDGMLWIAVLAEKNFRLDEWVKPGRTAVLNIGLAPDLPSGGIDAVDPCPGTGFRRFAPQLDWQISTPRPLRQDRPVYASLRVEGDSTRGLLQGGVIRLRLPATKEDIGLPPGVEDLAGAGDYPPQWVDDRAETLVCWLRAFRRDGSRLGKFRVVALNAVESENARVAEPEFLGLGDGQPSQVFALARQPVLPDDERHQLIVEVEEGGPNGPGGNWVRYTRVDDFFGSGRESRHVMMDPESALVRFGDGLRGRMPQFGERVRARGYRYGGGVAANVGAKAITKIDVERVKVSNPLPAIGGADAESVEDALLRIPGELRRRDRAVTASDFQELAKMTPGVTVGRAECLPRFHPPSKVTEAAGVVSVVIWPDADPRHPNAPLPDALLLRAVCEWLDTRRLVTTELYVIPPTYRQIAVSVAVKVKDGYGIEAVRRWVELVLRQYLAPLPPYGPAGQGWPLGRRVYGPELEAAALQVEGVEYLEGLEVGRWDAGAGKWLPGTVDLKIWEVPELAAITVVGGLPLPPLGEGVEPTGPDGVPLPIPVLREVC
jgi:hypothetical protein